ncbi:MAG TPA: Xaa-Pro peptidase family protein [Phycisphaerae bacterium]
MKTTSNGSPSQMIEQRLRACRAAMAEHDLPAYLVTAPADTFYLTGFTGEDSAVLITPRAVSVISDRRFDEVLDREAPWARKWMRKGSLTDEIARACRALKLERMAVQPEDMTLATHRDLAKKLRPRRLVKAPDIVRKLRRIKTADELAVMRRALQIAEDAFEATLRTIRLGQTELEIAARLEFEMKIRGATAPSFPTICAEGANASRPHARPGKRRVRRGSALLFDWGARFEQYCSDLTRVVFVRTIPPKMARIYEIVLQAQVRAIADIRPGRRMCDVDEVARAHIRKRGYGERFGHGLGHGLGLDVHEAPALSWRSQEELEAGMVVTVEPGIYLPRVGGVRIEDDVLVTSTGGEVLSRLPRNLDELVV